MTRHLVFFCVHWIQCRVCHARFSRAERKPRSSLTTGSRLFLTEAVLPFPVEVGR